MTRNRQKAKSRRDGSTFQAIPDDVLNSEAWVMASHRAISLLMDMVAQLRNKSGGAVNNGDLTVAYTVLKKRGWTSKDQIKKAKDELEHLGFILLTRQGGRHLPSLYAVTWLAIDECGRKLDVKPTDTPPGNWRGPKTKWASRKKSVPRHTGGNAIPKV